MAELNLEEIGKHYVIAALWTEQEEIGDAEAKDLSDEARAHVADSVAKFVEAAKDLLPAYIERREGAGGYSAAAQIGHDLWLTRNHHGVGFWDRGLEELGEALTKHAQDLCEVSLIRGDDGKLHFE